MATIKKKKNFHPLDYRKNIIILSLIVTMCAIGIGFVFSWSDVEINNYLHENSGRGEIGLGKLFMRFLTIFLGARVGFIIGMFFFFSMIAYELYIEIAAYRRYKKKCRLYQEGVIKSVYEIYDDYAPLSLWRRIKTCFTSKTPKYKESRKTGK